MVPELELGSKTIEVAPVPPPTVVIPPVTLTVIGNSSTSPSGTVIQMPGNHPNYIQNVITPLTAIMIRFINTFLTTLLGILLGSMSTGVIQGSDFIHLVIKCAGLSVAAAGVGLIKDCITIFGKLEQNFPLQTGSI